ncbi:MAG: DUF5348 domain-containing protein [Oscillospiraceae bacterium]|nr:DUF5348 domain-containing protein [Oscillospiraceae bacterium]
MADLQMAFSEAVKLNQSIAQFLKFTTYPDYDDLSGLDIDFQDGEQLLLLDELRRITDKLADVQEYISYLSRPVTEVSRLRKGPAGKYRTAKGHLYDCRSSIEALVEDEYHEVPYWTRTTVEHNGEDYYLVGYKGIPMKGLRVRVREQPRP